MVSGAVIKNVSAPTQLVLTPWWVILGTGLMFIEITKNIKY